MSRWKAFAIHFAISLMVFLVLLAIILTAWYPGILFSIDGGWNGMRLIIGVDLVLGPLLTLIVFKAGKPGLKFDLGCIALLQASCLAGGMWVVYQERPIALVLAYDTIYSLAAQEFEDYGKDPALLADFPGPYPKLIYTELPENRIQADIVAIRSQFIGDPLFIQTERFQPMPGAQDAIKDVFGQEQSMRATVTDALLGELPTDCLFSRFISAVRSGYVCFDPHTRSLSGFYGNHFARADQSAPDL